MMGVVDPPWTPPGSPDEPPRRSFEDFEVPVPTEAPRVRRPAVVSTAALVLFIAGAMNALFVVLFEQAGSIGSLYLMLAAAQLIAAVLLMTMLPIGRMAGLVMGGLGVVLGVIQATSAATSGLMSMALSGFVIWAVAASGPSFHRR